MPAQRPHLVVVASALVLAFVVMAAIPAAAAPGDLDPRFGGDGIVAAFPGGAIATAAAVDGHGRTVVGGYTVDGEVDVAVVRFTREGELDPRFGGGDGRVRLDLGASDFALDLALASDDGLVIAGRETSGTGDLAFVVRLGPAGVPLATFGGGDGIVTVGFGKPFQSAAAVAFTPAGRIVIGGYVSGGTTSRTALARLLPGGALDTSFHHDGRFTANLSKGAEQVHDLLVLPDGRIVAAGYVERGLLPRIAVVRIRGTGGLDPSFGDEGLTTIDPGPGADIGLAIARRHDGSFAVAGAADDDGHGSWAVVRLRPEGHRDAGFGDGGIVLLRFTSAAEEAAGILAAGPKLVVVGRIHAAATGADIGVVRLRSDGARDGSFGGGNGAVRIDLDGRADWAAGVATMPDGRIVVAGTGTRDGSVRLVAARLEAA
jgi:uncharacterized delta-60 repeat protein